MFCPVCRTNDVDFDRLGQLEEQVVGPSREGGRRVPAELREELTRLQAEARKRRGCRFHPHQAAEEPVVAEADPNAPPTDDDIISAVRTLQRAEAAGVLVRLPLDDEDDGVDTETEGAEGGVLPVEPEDEVQDEEGEALSAEAETEAEAE